MSGGVTPGRRRGDRQAEPEPHAPLDPALIDPLTGLLNRQALDRALRRESALAARAGTPLSVVLLSLDSFSDFRQRHGPALADEALRQEARLLARLTRSSDLLGRLEGDAFLLVLREWAPEAWRCAERLRAAVQQEVLQAVQERCTLSAGIAATEQASGDAVAALLKRAGTALETARQAGGNCIRIAPVQPPALRRPGGG